MSTGIPLSTELIMPLNMCLLQNNLLGKCFPGSASKTHTSPYNCGRKGSICIWARSRTWQYCPYGTSLAGIIQNDRVRRSWRFSPRFQKVTKARKCVARSGSLHGIPERPLCANLQRGNLSYSMLQMLSPWDICQRKLQVQRGVYSNAAYASRKKL